MADTIPYVRPFQAQQYGEGLGSILASLARFAVPAIKTSLKSAAPILKKTTRRVLPHVANAAIDLLDGEPIEKVVRKRGSQAIAKAMRPYTRRKRKRRRDLFD